MFGGSNFITNITGDIQSGESPLHKYRLWDGRAEIEQGEPKRCITYPLFNPPFLFMIFVNLWLRLNCSYTLLPHVELICCIYLLQSWYILTVSNRVFTLYYLLTLRELRFDDHSYPLWIYVCMHFWPVHIQYLVPYLWWIPHFLCAVPYNMHICACIYTYIVQSQMKLKHKLSDASRLSTSSSLSATMQSIEASAGIELNCV